MACILREGPVQLQLNEMGFFPLILMGAESGPNFFPSCKTFKAIKGYHSNNPFRESLLYVWLSLTLQALKAPRVFIIFPASNRAIKLYQVKELLWKVLLNTQVHKKLTVPILVHFQNA